MRSIFLGSKEVIIAAIPVKNHLKWTAPLVESLLLGDRVDEIWIYDNGSIDKTMSWVIHRSKTDERLKYIDATEWKFYDMWNHMIKTAAELGEVKLAILNNDIRLPHMALKTMAENMGDYKIATIDKTRDSFDLIEGPAPKQVDWLHRAGWAFMVDADFWKDQEYAIHPDFIIWWGDDDLYRRAESRGGKICAMVGIGCDHAISATDTEYSGDKQEHIEIDRATFSRIWG
jgi:GT2 family glycosyltransferase